MKVHILYNTTDLPHGGGNQFLKGLRKQFIDLDAYTFDAKLADVFLFNSHHNLDLVKNLKEKYGDKKFIHRIDGPMRLYNTASDNRDFVVYRANSELADGTIFQSEWSYNANLALGFTSLRPTAVIHNSIDLDVFNCADISNRNSGKIRLISCSFSPNLKKGYRAYQFIDEHLDFNQFEYVFAGNSPVRFRNIKNLGCLDSINLATELRKSDIYVTASENDPCSNSLLEAMSCGLKILALNSGGHPEIIGDDNSLFDSHRGLLEKITNHDTLNNPRQLSTMKSVAMKYLEFFDNVKMG